MQWILYNWAKIGGIALVGILVFVFYLHQNDQILFWLHLVTLLIHQFEEYVLPGGFKDFFNTHIAKKNRVIRFPLND